MGDIVGESQPGVLVTLFGTALVVTAIWALVRFAFEGRTTTGGRPLALSLILFGLLFSGLTAYGRSGLAVFGFDMEDRYTVFAILVLVGSVPRRLGSACASELDRRNRVLDRWREAQIDCGTSSPIPSSLSLESSSGWAIVLTVIIGSANGISQARAIRQNRLYLGQVTVRANQYPDTVVNNLDWLETAQSIRHRITDSQGRSPQPLRALVTR